MFVNVRMFVWAFYMWPGFVDNYRKLGFEELYIGCVAIFFSQKKVFQKKLRMIMSF